MSEEIEATVVVELDIGDKKLSFEQIEDIDGLMEEAIVTHAPAPYWAYLWPSARALAEHIGKRLDLMDRRVLELGCGLGAPGISAAARGAKVTLSDERKEAIVLAKKNAARNGVEVEALTFDWNHPPEGLGTFEVILAADVFYEDGMLASVIRFLSKHLAKDGEAFLADPMRVLPSAVDGAARFRGLAVDSEVLVEPGELERGVRLFRLLRASRRLVRKGE